MRCANTSIAAASVRPVPRESIAGLAPRRILVVKLSSFGDVVLATAALRALRRAFPASDLRVAVERRWAPALAACPFIDGVVEASSDDRLTPTLAVEIARTLAAERRARGPFDLALDLQGLRRSAAWIYLSRARVKAGRGSPRPGWRASFPIDRSRHAVQALADVCENLGVRARDLDPSLATSRADEARLDAILDEARIARRGFVLLNLFSGWRSKAWSVANAAALASHIASSTGDAVVVTGGPDEAALADDVVRGAKPGSAVSLAGRLTLGEAICLCGRARLMVSCDSGPMHAAAALGTPVVALFGPTLPEHSGPWGAGHRVVQALRPPDHHAYRREGAERYMDALGVDAVAAVVDEELRAVAPRAANVR